MGFKETYARRNDTASFMNVRLIMDLRFIGEKLKFSIQFIEFNSVVICLRINVLMQ